MAMLIKQVKVEEVPDDKIVEIVHMEMRDPRNVRLGEANETLSQEIVEPFVVRRPIPMTIEEMQSGELPKMETLVMFVPKEFQERLCLVYEAWSWLSDQYMGLSETVDRQRSVISDKDSHIDALREKYFRAPWYKRVWRVLWLDK